MSGKVVIVTGASRGIGEATARACARRGARLVLCARSRSALAGIERSLDGLGAEYASAVGDLAERSARAAVVSTALDTFGALDGLVNNAGLIDPIGFLADTDTESWEHQLAVNLLAPAELVRLALPALRASRGRIVGISSGAAVGPVPGWSAYCTSKAGLNHLTRVLALEEPEVVSLTLSPGMTATDMQARIRETGPEGMPPAVLARFLDAFEGGRLADPERVGEITARLALAAPSAWSGEFLSLDDPALTHWLADEANGA